MGFLKNFSEPFAFALALWPFVSMLLTVPVLALLYHRDNRIRLSSAIVAYGTVLYLLGLLCFTLYPMPADADIKRDLQYGGETIGTDVTDELQWVDLRCQMVRGAIPQYCRSPRRCFWRRCS